MRRGGLGVIFEFRFVGAKRVLRCSESADVSHPLESSAENPQNRQKHTFILQGEEYNPPHISKDEGIPMQAGDILRLETPGGGGYGNPTDRHRSWSYRMSNEAIMTEKLPKRSMVS